MELSLRGLSLPPEILTPGSVTLPQHFPTTEGAVGLCLRTGIFPPTEPEALPSMEGTSVPCDKGQN